MDEDRILPVQIGKEYDLEISEDSKIGGDGVARVSWSCSICKEREIGRKG
jgi:predicted RNA-binding protein with TRAM domain